MKIAIVCDWLVTWAGAEKVLEQILHCYPESDLFAVVDFVDEAIRKQYLQGKHAQTTFIQKLPFAKKKYRTYLPFMPLAIEQLDVSKYDLVISSSHAVAKGVITGPDQLHISYVHTPMRYAWDLQFQYLKQAGLDKSLKGWLARRMLHKLRVWDYCSSARVDHYMANSGYIARRIEKVYRRKAQVVYPPVDVEAFKLNTEKEDFYLTVSRLVPYKRIDLIVKAFSNMPDKRLVVIGAGPDFSKIQKLAASNVTLLGYQEDEILKDYMQRAKAFVFAAEEDFGIVPVEAQACGTPVIVYGKGGVLETVQPLGAVSEPTGILFNEQTEKSLISAVLAFEQNQACFNPETCRNNALGFSNASFQEAFKGYVEKVSLDFFDQKMFHKVES